MSITPHRDAAIASVEECRRRYAALNIDDPIRLIGQEMNIDACRAVLVGVGDMMDRDVTAGRAAMHVNETVASMLASIILTLVGGHEVLALGCVDMAISDVRERLIIRIKAAKTEAVYGRVAPSELQGQA